MIFCVLSSAPAAFAQGAAGEEKHRQATADRIARSAVLMLRRTNPPMPIDYQLCAEQLRLALTLDPDNPYFVRRMREALYSAGDLDGFNEATRRLSRLEPEDTVLQLSVVSGRITAIQNVDDRLAAYARLLGPAGETIDNSVRSRLAFDAALLAQELGDQERFVSLLTMATQLDSTNKQAAARAADYSVGLVDDPEGRVEMLANVILADPLDPSAHLNLAREFLSHGATHAGERFLNHAVTLWQMQGYQQDQGTLLQRYALQWLHEGEDSVLEDLDELVSVRRYMIEQQRKALEEAGEDPNEAGEFKHDPLIERIRLIVASAHGRSEIAQSAMLNIEKSVNDVIVTTQESLEGEDPPDPEVVERMMTELLIQSLYLRLWSGEQIDKAEATIEQFVSSQEKHQVTPEAIARYRGWVAARRGDFETAERLLGPQAEQEPFAMLGLGVAAETSEDLRGAVRSYAKVALMEPGSMMGTWARKRLEGILGSTLSPTPQAMHMERLAETLPKTIDRMVSGPGSFLVVSSSHVSNEIDRLGRVLLNLSIRNVGPIPVAVGERAPVRTSTLLIPRLVIAGYRVEDSVDPEVVSLNRRLRLMPRESMEVVIWADQGPTGALMDIDTETPLTLRWRSIIGFDIDQYGQYASTGTSLDHESDLSSRGRLEGLGDNIDDVALMIELTESGSPLFEALLQARSILLRTLNSNAGDASDIRVKICDTIAARYATMTPIERAFTIVMMPPAQAMVEALAVDEAAQDDADRVIKALLLRRVMDPTDPRFAAVIESDDADLSRLARLYQIRLERMIKLSTPAQTDNSGED